MKRLPKKFDKLTPELFKMKFDDTGWPYWSFEFGIDGYKVNEIILFPHKERMSCTMYDENKDPIDGLSGETTIQIKKSNKGPIPKWTKKSWDRVMRMANDIYNLFYE